MSTAENLNLSNRLLKACGDLERSLMTFKDINQKAHFIALSAAIEGARMRSRLGTFSIVASQIAAQASKNNQLSEELEQLIARIKIESLEAIAVRNLELSMDLIDKLDRNLFERNCDVQAWAGFEEIKRALTSPSEDSSKLAGDVLGRLTGIYVVYSESLLLDVSGNVAACAAQKNFIGMDLSSEDWFKGALAGQVIVTDLHFSEILKSRAVFYCAPVLSDDNNVIGVLCNCFNWDYAQEMIQSGGFSRESKAIIINSQGTVIASGQEHQILNDTATWLEAGEIAIADGCGISNEKARNGASLAVGFAHTKGYNAYKGKNWSAIVLETIGDIDMAVGSKIIEMNKKPDSGRIKIASEISGYKLLETMKKIDDLVLEINANNREVKLLAVNASIQAGLAGAEGEGFSIIANEVAVLAKKSLSFVEEVNQITVQLREAVEFSSSVRLVDAARDTMSKIDRNLFERFCDIQAWAIFGTLVEACKSNQAQDAESMALLEKIHRIYEVYHDIYILSLDGRVLASAINRSVIGQNFSSKDWFRSAQAGSIFVSDIYVSETLKTPLMTFSSPIHDSEGRIIGVIASRFNCNFLNDILRATIVDSLSRCFLINTSGAVVGSAANDDILNKQMNGIETVKSNQTQDSGFVENTKIGNEEFCLGFSNSKGYNTFKGQKWMTIVERPLRLAHMTKKLTPAERFTEVVLERSKRAA